MTILYLQLLGIHFIADFVLQSGWMAQNKSKSNWPLFCHIATYFITFLFLLVVIVRPGNFEAVFFYTFINAVVHFLVDFVTSRINSYLWVKGDIHNFFVGIGFDQLIHSATLISTAYWIFT